MAKETTGAVFASSKDLKNNAYALSEAEKYVYYTTKSSKTTDTRDYGTTLYKVNILTNEKTKLFEQDYITINLVKLENGKLFYTRNEIQSGTSATSDKYLYINTLSGEDFTKSFGVGDYEKDLNKGQYYLNLKGGRFVVEFSLTNTGSWAVDGFYQQSLKNYTVPNISTYDGLVEAAALPFMDEYGVAPTLPEEITFTPESYRLVDYRYNLIITNGNDIGHPAVLLGFIGATAENKDALINSFVSVGYTEKVVDDVTFYESNASSAHAFGASFNYYEAEVDKEGNITSPSMVVVLIV